jgi:hypothetical protein
MTSTPARPTNSASRPLCLVGAATLLALAVACGGDGDSTPSAVPTPAPSTPAQSSPVSGEGIIDLAAVQPLMTIWGANTGDYLNDLPALDTGDVNGDGVEDLLIGARFGDGPQEQRQDAGELYIIFGRDKLPPQLDLASAQANVTVHGAAANDQLGYDAILADLNRDGRDDLVLGAPYARRPDSAANSGIVYVIFGAAEMNSVIDLSEATAHVILLGADSSDYFGDSLAAGDVNGDGVEDLIIGATFARRLPELSNPGAHAGASYVVFGDVDFGGTHDMAQAQYDAAVYGVNDQPHSDELGDKVAAGDLNGDGVADIAITAEAADGPDDSRSVAAEVHVIYGSPELAGIFDIAAGDQDLSVWGAEQNDTLGFNLALGDVSGDGVVDLLMTARGGDGPNNSMPEGGEVHIVFGRDDLPSEIDLLKDEGDAVIHGDGQADMLGTSLRTVDIDSDASLLIGTPFGDGPAGDRPEAGEVYILDARSATGEAPVLSLPRRLALYGRRPDDAFGATAVAGDLNANGRIEIIVLALRADGPDASRPDAGEIYVIEP